MEVYFLKRTIADQLRETEFWHAQDPALSAEFLKELDKASSCNHSCAERLYLGIRTSRAEALLREAFPYAYPLPVCAGKRPIEDRPNL